MKVYDIIYEDNITNKIYDTSISDIIDQPKL